MDLEHLLSAEAIGREALKLEPGARAEFLERRCADKPTLRGEVEFFIEMHSRGAVAEADQAIPDQSSPVDVGARRVEVRIGAESPDKAKRRLPERIGPFRIVEQIGQGGFGVVYLAEQEEPVRRRVALKIIKLGMDTPEVLARFEAERQALALMDHPGVAHVFDAGTTEMGRPYFAMEYVQGVPITDYCDKNRLSNRERLDLFIRVCEAVQHAHQKGIIHRDLKPSNIMVTMQDEKPAPKVIDFGIAKALHQKLTDHTLHTERGQLIGTPEYMSPEQAEMSGLDIDTRADIYSLGVVLYQLLIGTLPFDSASLRMGGPLAVQRAIREQDAQKPSTLLQTRRDSTPSIAHNRNTDPDTLIRQIRGDLDWITLKAVEKDRTRRYASASELAADVRRYLNDEPVLATPPSTAYRMKKFVRRHRAFVVASAAVSVAVVAGLSSATYGFIRARSEKEKTEKVADFMQQTLAGAGPSVARGRDTTMLREMMDTAADRINRGELSQAPEAEIRMRETIGTTYRDLAAFDRAAEMLAPAVMLARRTYSAKSPELASVLQASALLNLRRADSATAETQAREALEIYRRRYPGDRDEVASALGVLAEAQMARGNLSEAEASYRAALAMHQRLFGPDHLQVAADLSNVGVVLTGRGEIAEATACGEKSLAIRKRAFAGDHPEIAVVLDNLAVLYDRAGNYQLAEDRSREALAMRRRLFSGDHDEIATSLLNQAVYLNHQNKKDEARKNYNEAIAMLRRLFPSQHPQIARALRNLGELEKTIDDRNSAAAHFDDALRMQQALFSGDHTDVAATLDSIGMLHWDAGDFAGAEPYLRKSAEMMRRLTGGRGDELSRHLMNLGDTMRRLGKLDEAEALERESLTLLDATFPGDHPSKLIILGNLTVTLQSAGKLPQAEDVARQRLAILQRIKPGDPPLTAAQLIASTANQFATLTQILADEGRLDDAEAFHRGECELLSQTPSPNDAEGLACRTSLGLLMADSAWQAREDRKEFALKKAREAEELLRENIVARGKIMPAEDWRLAHGRNGLGEAELCVALLDPALSAEDKSNRLAEAGKLLTESLPPILKSAAAPLRRRRQATERVIHFYEATGRADQAGQYRRQLDSLVATPASQPATRPS